ncbi:DNA polymerase III beta subunit-like protein [Kribbella sp. VKM Ac-2527]|uniref:DNA polymerase III beta subunit-like protein n=1 Tax=Kribbella caucasensis TaxID=2512215 RepID=A0A4R6KQD4_9ACTN|nr:MerR family transcriptional regulator [Kribbella sp. VKM Ac-2527]TDO54589.1 DNA polymerase III beta subunit-like protein [Kribbella sp. VKM Ac-2527]
MVDGLLTISGFARRVGLTPSALRFYDDCELLRPAVVDEGNGYRYYAPDQEPRARLLRDLREIDLPLAEVRQVLDGGPVEAAAVVRAHLRTVEGKADAARRAASRILGSLVPSERSVVLGGPELASAIRQVAPSAASTDEIPALACVQLELGEDEVTLVATDRYRLAVRKLHPHEFTGTPGAILVRADELTGLARWVAAAAEIRIETGPTGATLIRMDGTARLAGAEEAAAGLGGGEVRELGVRREEFPAYQGILQGLAPPTCRVVVDRLRLRELLGDGVVALGIDSGRVEVEGRGRVEAIGSGEAVRIGFAAALLAAALEASVGPDVLLEVCAEDRPVVVRSADQGTFTTLVMPTRL